MAAMQRQRHRIIRHLHIAAPVLDRGHRAQGAHAGTFEITRSGIVPDWIVPTT